MHHVVALLLGCLIVFPTVHGCEKNRQQQQTPTVQDQVSKVVLLGVDGLSWQVLNTLMNQGKLPNFQAIVASGSSGVLRAAPPLVSPALWTTIATGVYPNKHGITDYRVDDRPIQAGDRRVAAVWEQLSGQGKSVGVVGWWATWPATNDANGYIVSDRFVSQAWQTASTPVSGDQQIQPPALAKSLLDFARHPRDVSEAVRSVIGHPLQDWPGLVKAAESDAKSWQRSVIYGIADQQAHIDIATSLLKQFPQPDLLALYWVANEAISQYFWHFYDPQRFERKAKHTLTGYSSAITNAYIATDRALGQLRERVDAQTTWLIVSDHGYQATGKQLLKPMVPQVSAQPYVDGVIIASGPGIRQGARVFASNADVAPTILTLLGAPVPAEIDGRVLHGMLGNGMLRSQDVRSGERKNAAPQVMRRPADNTHLKDRLESMGYE